MFQNGGIPFNQSKLRPEICYAGMAVNRVLVFYNLHKPWRISHIATSITEMLIIIIDDVRKYGIIKTADRDGK